MDNYCLSARKVIFQCSWHWWPESGFLGGIVINWWFLTEANKKSTNRRTRSLNDTIIYKIFCIFLSFSPRYWLLQMWLWVKDFSLKTIQKSLTKLLHSHHRKVFSFFFFFFNIALIVKKLRLFFFSFFFNIARCTKQVVVSAILQQPLTSFKWPPPEQYHPLLEF